MIVEATASNPAIINLDHPGARVRSELTGEAIPCIPRRDVGIHEDSQGTATNQPAPKARRYHGIECLDPQEIQRQALVGYRNPSDRGIEPTV